MSYYNAFVGTLTMINELQGGASTPPGCYLIMTIEDENQSIVNFIVNRNTYFVNHVTLLVGDLVEGFYDVNAPVPLIYPPQFTAIVMNKVSDEYMVTVDHFNRELVNDSNTLKLNIGPETNILLSNDQSFQGDLYYRDLIVTYTFTTRSIPAITTPTQIVVLC